jgi:type II secretory pathway pseudopilin PulG
MRPSARQQGYNMVMLMIAITVLNIMVAIALPMWSQEIQRDKEEELISRGFQYVEAIRVFQNRFQRLPVRLEELIEVKPRCIRRLWKDPMTDEKMQPVFQNEGQAVTPPPPENPSNGGKPTGGKPTGGKPTGGKPASGKPGTGKDQPKDPDDDSHIPTDPNGVPLGDQPQVTSGPITGVRSRSSKKSILVFAGKERYDEWRFTIDMVLQGRPAPGQNPAPGAPGAGLQLSTRWIGRPLPSSLQAGNLPQPGDPMPGGSGANPPVKKPPAKVPHGGSNL